MGAMRHCDVMIIGGGGAGLRAAIKDRESGVSVTVVSKSRVGHGNNTFIPKASFAAATGWRDSSDNPNVHLKDTIIGGRFINDQRLLKVVTQEAVGQIEFLQMCGVKLSEREGRIEVLHPPGHSYPRHVCGQNSSGRDFMIPLRVYAERIVVRFMDRVFITRLVKHLRQSRRLESVNRSKRLDLNWDLEVFCQTNSIDPAFCHVLLAF
jgi:succinate dehydrogenase/fumarate reductase flavoprotein subunit